MSEWMFFLIGSVSTALVMFAIEEYLSWRERSKP